MRKLLMLAVAGLGACTLGVVYDLEVHWTVSGSAAASACTTYNIHSWRVTLTNGPEIIPPKTFGCGTWDSGLYFHAIEEGYYDINMEALNAGGTSIAQKGLSRVFVGAGASNIDPYTGVVDIDFNFSSNDFVVTSGPKINFYWNLNGTENGTATGKSWDTCDEVGASKVRVIVDSNTTDFPCEGTVPGKMSGAIAVSDGAHNVTMRLLDSSSTAITNDATGAVTATTSGGEFVADFFFNSFKKSTTGSYLFATQYEGKSCGQTSPTVYSQLTLLKLGGSPVTPTPQVCGPDNVCVATDGAAFGACYDPDETQKIKNLTWGFYKMKLQGTLSVTSAYEICWEDKNDSTQFPSPWPTKDNSNEVDILVGAGTTNPTLMHDLTRISTSGACAL
jgi:hypothetical protein